MDTSHGRWDALVSVWAAKTACAKRLHNWKQVQDGIRMDH